MLAHIKSRFGPETDEAKKWKQTVDEVVISRLFELDDKELYEYQLRTMSLEAAGLQFCMRDRPRRADVKVVDEGLDKLTGTLKAVASETAACYGPVDGEIFQEFV